MTAASDPTPLAPEIRALILKAVIGMAEDELKELAKPLSASYPLPSKATFESPLDGALLGYVQRARTTPSWKVTAELQLLEYMRAEHPNAVETVFLLDVPGVASPVVLAEDHPITVAIAQVNPDLLTPQQQVRAEVVEAALAQSEEDGIAAAPGIQLIRARPGNLNIVPDKKDAVAAIGRMVRAGWIDWSGRPVVEAVPPKAVAS